MKKFELITPSLVCGLFLLAASTPSALANAYYTYEFTANPGQLTWYNGTTVEIEDNYSVPTPYAPYTCELVGGDFHGALDLAAWAGDPPYFPPAPASLTPFSFSLPAFGTVNGIDTANAFGFTGEFFGIGGGATVNSGNGYSTDSGEYYATDSEIYWSVTDPGFPQPTVTESPIASGTWSIVPDAGSSFELLVMAMAVLGAGRLLLCMKKIKLTVASLICGLFVVAVSTPNALANAYYTYEFNAGPELTGTIEIFSAYDPYSPYLQDCSLVYMHMSAELSIAAWAGGDGYGPQPAFTMPSLMTLPFRATGYPSILESSALDYANPSGWGYEFDTGWGGAIPFYCPDLEVVLESSSVSIYVYGGGLDPGAFIPMSVGGTWSLVPDACSSFELLAMAMTTLGAGRLLLCGRKN